MSFRLPKYNMPDFLQERFVNAPNAIFLPCEKDKTLPDNFHSTSMFPEYFKINGNWVLAPETRMDSQVIMRDEHTLDVVEMRNVKKGDLVAVGRNNSCSEGIYVHADAFPMEKAEDEEFAFRSARSRETSYARDYDELIELLKYERDHGNILWVMGPAFTFDSSARYAMQAMVENGYAHGLLAGNALATHDLEGAYFHTALGQDIYTQKNVIGGHNNHMDIINMVCRAGSISEFIEQHNIDNGIMYSIVKKNVPFVLTGSIRDDGPLPEVYHNVYEGATAMRQLVKRSTTVICLATMLHTIATGNMTPCFRRLDDGTIRPIYLYCIDSAEFVVNKLLDRGSLAAKTMVVNAQDFIIRVARGVGAI